MEPTQKRRRTNDRYTAPTAPTHSFQTTPNQTEDEAGNDTEDSDKYYGSPTPSTVLLMGSMDVGDGDETITLKNHCNAPPEERKYVTPKRLTIDMKQAQANATPNQNTTPSPSEETEKPENHMDVVNEAPENNNQNSEAASLREALENLKVEAKEQAGLDLFMLAPALKQIRLNKARPDENIVKNALETIEWLQIPTEGLSTNLLHQSGNPLDFMRDDTIVECQKAINGEENKLGLTRLILVNKIHRVLVRVASTNCPKENQMMWTRHAIRSTLSKAGLPLDGLVAMLDMKKLGYDWKVAALTKQAFDAISKIRALHDPRTRVTVFIRKWDLNPPRTQTIRFNGIITQNDRTERDKELELRVFTAQLAEQIRETNVKIAKAWNITDTEHTTTYISFETPELNPIRIEPRNLPRTFAATDSTRQIKPSWIKKCHTCHSESHWEEEECPWTKYNFEGKLLDMQNAKRFQPGQTESRKRTRDEANIEEGLADTRVVKKKKEGEKHETKARETTQRTLS
ncbi:hypothetical protein FRC14_005421 [Serendipita sp. 396]|nr:hypothetical protein FRC14_005421 [Serendipita sp. 396]KAG8781041.1 hypothetical protein FRC15_009067 [Serendipita sp. 397]KAG8796954.1 hypothetical protein FRC16_009349 [Serendipita sp. 398]KAG8823145.1 hypothetical protein FRC19_004544 [Serendipita sp. 401]KAG8864118.1 hypothetical protein FRC20_010408 [Serendipita sp. 405]KAG9053803.1 hypothetical protein FS842_007109 [Serendipita sp. 407]